MMITTMTMMHGKNWKSMYVNSQIEFPLENLIKNIFLRVEHHHHHPLQEGLQVLCRIASQNIKYLCRTNNGSSSAELEKSMHRHKCIVENLLSFCSYHPYTSSSWIFLASLSKALYQINTPYVCYVKKNNESERKSCA